jgi:hypothetical protein
MRDLLSKLDAIVSETALQDKSDLQAKRKALQDLQMNPVASDDPEIKQAIIQRKADLEKEAKAKGFTESFEIGDEFGISFSEDHEIATTIVDILEDGIVIELDDTAISMLTNEGLTFLEGEIVNEDKQKGVDGKACWKGYKRMGTKQKGGKTVDNCVKSEDLDEYFQFEFPKGKDRGPRDHGHDELARREKTMGKGGLAKDARDYKEKDKYGDAYKIKGPKGKLPEDQVDEAEYQGRKVQLGKKMAGDVKKSKVYVRNPKGNVVKVNFGDKKMKIKKSNPARRKSFRARHNCANPGPRHKARYWSCRSW